MKLTMEKETVIVQGIRPEEQIWGAYQFPRPYDLGDKLVVGVHVTNDDMKSFGETNRWFESRDRGASWQEIHAKVAVDCGLLLPNGDKLYLPMESGFSLKDYQMTPECMLTPGYDFTKQAPEGVLPVPDGITAWIDGTVIRAYNADRLPPSLAKKEWLAKRIKAGQTGAVEERVKVDWPNLTRVVFSGPSYDRVMKPIFPRGTPKLGPDGAIWVSAFSGEGHLHPVTGKYSPYYSAELFRSVDFGHSFQLRGHLEYEANGREYPYQSGGFSDSDFEFMPDSSIIWFLRSNCYVSTGREWSPMYFTRSVDQGRTWSKPVEFAPVGILPRLCTLKNGVTLLCYARPGTFVQACLNAGGTEWSEPLEVMTPGDRSQLGNVKVDVANFHQWVGSCNNPEILPVSDDSVLIFYSDFYYPAPDGVKRKSILCRKITVQQ